MLRPTTRLKLVATASVIIAVVIYMTSSYNKQEIVKPTFKQQSWEQDNIKTDTGLHPVADQIKTVDTDSTRRSNNHETKQISTNDTKTILMMYHPDKFTDQQIQEIFKQCPDVKCKFTHDERAIVKSSAVIFHYIGPHVYSMPKRQPGQLWFYYNLERPALMKHELARYITEQKMFNGTINYYPSSLVWFPYGKYNGTHVWTYNTIHNTFLNTNVNFAAKKDKLLFWAASNCNAASKRQDYVKELKKYVKVDIYGGCGSLKCPRSSHCEETVFKKYKFYLAFENKICKDYITEKLWQTLATREAVPIVLGGADHEEYLPPKSYIDIRDFATPADLANYLKKLDKNNDLYNEYFSWRYKKTSVFDFTQARSKWPLQHYICQVCHLVHTPNLEKSFVDFIDINSDIHNCINPAEYYEGRLPGY